MVKASPGVMVYPANDDFIPDVLDRSACRVTHHPVIVLGQCDIRSTEWWKIYSRTQRFEVKSSEAGRDIENDSRNLAMSEKFLRPRSILERWSGPMQDFAGSHVSLSAHPSKADGRYGLTLAA